MGVKYISSEIQNENQLPDYNRRPIDSIVEGVFYRVNDRLRGSKQWEEHIKDRFDFRKPHAAYRHRGDFLCKDNNLYYEHKGGALKDSFNQKSKHNKTYDMIELKFSNVYEKMFVEFIKKEMDLIFEDYNNLNTFGSKSPDVVTNDEDLLISRYSGEFTRSSLKLIDSYVERCLKYLKKSEYTPKSRCVKEGIDFTDYCDLLCMVNLRMYSNIVVNLNDTYAFFDLTNFWLYVSYIGFGGFKIVFFYGEQSKNTPNGSHKTVDLVEGRDRLGRPVELHKLSGDRKKLLNPHTYLESVRKHCGGKIYPEIIELMKVLYLKDIKSEIKHTWNRCDYGNVFNMNHYGRLNKEYNFLTEEIKDFIYKKYDYEKQVLEEVSEVSS